MASVRISGTPTRVSGTNSRAANGGYVMPRFAEVARIAYRSPPARTVSPSAR